MAIRLWHRAIEMGSIVVQAL